MKAFYKLKEIYYSILNETLAGKASNNKTQIFTVQGNSPRVTEIPRGCE